MSNLIVPSVGSATAGDKRGSDEMGQSAYARSRRPAFDLTDGRQASPEVVRRRAAFSSPPGSTGRGLLNVPLHAIPKCRPLEHTMSHSITTYVESKVPTDVLDAAAAARMKVIVVGSPCVKSASSIWDCSVNEPLNYSYISQSKELNFQRPEWLFTAESSDLGEEALVVRVFPSLDYTCHLASLLLDALTRRVSKAASLLHIAYDIDSEVSLARWTGLVDLVLPERCVVVLGFVDSIAREAGDEAIVVFENEWYKVWALGARARLVGCKFSFWGRLSGRIVRHFCGTGRLDHLIYFGKLGTLTSAADLYNVVFSPDTFMAAAGMGLIASPFVLENRLLQSYPQVRGGCHASVPTIMEETFQQREMLSAWGVQTLDNEISFMAREIRRHNARTGQNVAFSPFHYATDYIRERREWFLRVPFDLTSGREPLALMKRSAIHSKISNMILSYIRCVP